MGSLKYPVSHACQEMIFLTHSVWLLGALQAVSQARLPKDFVGSHKPFLVFVPSDCVVMSESLRVSLQHDVAVKASLT